MERIKRKLSQQTLQSMLDDIVELCEKGFSTQGAINQILPYYEKKVSTLDGKTKLIRE